MANWTQRYDGEWVDVTDGQNLACCDCGLVHKQEYAVLDGRILVRVFRNNRKTAGQRRSLRIKKAGVFARKKKR